MYLFWKTFQKVISEVKYFDKNEPIHRRDDSSATIDKPKKQKEYTDDRPEKRRKAKVHYSFFIPIGLKGITAIEFFRQMKRDN